MIFFRFDFYLLKTAIEKISARGWWVYACYEEPIGREFHCDDGPCAVNEAVNFIQWFHLFEVTAYLNDALAKVSSSTLLAFIIEKVYRSILIALGYQAIIHCVAEEILAKE